MKHTATPEVQTSEIEDSPIAVEPLPEQHRTSDEHAMGGPLRVVQSTLSPAQIIERLARESKRGRLAGFRALRPCADGTPAAAVTAFGGLYDYDLIIRPRARDDGQAGSRVGFELRLLRKMPAVAILLFIFSIVPGLQLTHSMLSIYFSWYTIQTWWWYIPLVLLSAPLMWRQFKQSQAEARRDAGVTIGKIEGLLTGK